MRIYGEPADIYDAYIVRGLNRQGETDYQYEVLELLERLGTLVINSPAGLSLAESKAQTTFCLKQAGIPVPSTLVTQSVEEAATAVKAFGTAVVKPLYGSHGIGIEKLEPDMNGMLRAFLKKYGAIYVQEYIPNEGRDIRAFVVGDEIPAAVYRIAPEGQWKTNVFQGSRCIPCELTPDVREICLESVRVIGVDYTGVDVIVGPDGPVVLELNGAPCWYGLCLATNCNVALDIMSYTLRLLESGQSARQPAVFRSWQRTL